MNLQANDRSQVLKGIKAYQRTDSGDTTKIKGATPPQFRLRLGKIRVLFLREGNHITIFKIAYRGDLGWNEASLKTASSREVETRTAARAGLPLLAPDELKAQGAHTAADDYPQLVDILWERPDLIEAEPVQGMPRRMMLGSKTYPTDTGGQIDRVKAAEIMFGTGSPQHLKAVEKYGPKTAAVNEPVWLKERRSNPIKDSLNDKNQPWWWRKVVGPSLDRYNDAVPPNRQIKDYDDIHKVDTDSWCRFRRRGECYFPKDFDEQGSEEAGYAVWIPYNRGECPWKSWDAQKHSCKVSEPGPKSNEVVMYPDATVSWSQGGQRTSSITETPVSITRKAESSWVDVREKAKRIRQSGGVRIISALDDSVTGEVRGDTGLYTATVTTVPGSNQVALATCSCPWETYRWARSGPWKKLEGRACAHITALLFEMQARKMFGGEITEDVAAPEWRTEQPALENPKSKPGPWRLDVAASVQSHLASVTAQRDSLEARAAVHVYLDPQVLSLGLAVANLADDESGEGALVSVAKLLEARSLIDVPPFYAQVSGEIVVVDGFDESGTPWANGRALSRRQIMYPTFHPTRGITGVKSLGVDWVMPGKKRPFATSTMATSDLIKMLGEEGHTVQSAHDALLYDPEGKAILAAFIAAGYINTPLADLVGGEMAQDLVHKASLEKTAAHSGVMVALVPSAEVAATISLAAAEAPGVKPEPAEEIHLTVAYCGKAVDIDRAAFMGAVQGIAAAAGTLRGTTSGWGSFDNETEKVLWSSVDVPGLDVMRLMVVEGLVAAGVPVATNHGFTPHITAGYAEEPISAFPETNVAGQPLVFDCLVAAYAGEWTYFDLSDPLGEPVMGETKTAMFEARPEGEVLATEGEIVYRRQSVLNDRGIEAWLLDRTLIGVLLWSDDGKIFSVDVERRHQRRGIATRMFELAKQVEPKVHHSTTLTEDGKAWSKAVGASKTAEYVPGAEGLQAVLDASEDTELTHAGLVIKAADSGRVLMTQRTPYHADDDETYGSWEFPGGAIDEGGETAFQAALREFREETGLELPENHRYEGASKNGTYLAIMVTVPNESWTTNATLLPLETMGIGWFDPEHVEDSPLTRPEVDDSDWEMIKDAARKQSSLGLDDFDMLDVENGFNEAMNSEQWINHGDGTWTRFGADGLRVVYERSRLKPEMQAKYETLFGSEPFAWERFINIWVVDIPGGRKRSGTAKSLDAAKAKSDKNPPGVDAQVAKYNEHQQRLLSQSSLDEAEAILHDEPEPALPEALGSVDGMDVALFGSEMHTPSTMGPRSRPEDMFQEEEIPEVDPIGIQNLGGIDSRVAWLMDEPAQGGDDDIAMAAQAVLSKMALKTFSIEEQHELIHEGAEDNRGARNTDRLSIEGTHYEYEAAASGGELDTELLW